MLYFNVIILYITNDVYSCSIGAFLYKPFVLPLVPHYFKYYIYMSLCICILYVEINEINKSTCTYRDRAFAPAPPILWNKLPDKLRAEQTTGSFTKSLKTYLFSL